MGVEGFGGALLKSVRGPSQRAFILGLANAGFRV